MRFLGVALIAGGVFIYWQIASEQTGNMAIEIQKINEQVPNYWIILVIVGAVMTFFPKAKSKKTYQPISRPTRPEYSPAKEVEESKPATEIDSEDESTEDAEDDPTDSQSWKDVLKQEALALKLPFGAKIKTDPMKDVPFALRLERTTPQNTKIALDKFTQFLNKSPTPKRIIIEFSGIMDGGLPKQNLVKFACQKNLKNQSFIITTSLEGVDIRFQNHADDWGEHCNLEKKFG